MRANPNPFVLFGTWVTYAAVAAQNASAATFTLEKVALTGDQAPAPATDATYNSFSQFFGPQIDAAGRVAFLGLLNGPGVDGNNNAVLVSGGRGDLRVVAREGDPFFDSGETLADFDALRLNAGGDLAFTAILRGQAVGPTNDRAIVASTGDQLRLVAREGDEVPGSAPNVVFSEVTAPVFNSAGQTAFLARIAGPGITSLSDTVLFSEGPRSLEQLAREGQQPPGAGAGTTYRDFFTPSPQLPSINEDGHTAFFARLSAPQTIDTAIYLNDTLTTSLIQGRGGAATVINSQAIVAEVREPRLNAAGQAIYTAFLFNAPPGVTSSNDSAVFVSGADGLHVVAREGDHAPGTDPGVVFDVFGDLTNPVIGGSGHAAFLATLDGPNVRVIAERGIWATGSDGQLSLIARGEDPAPGPGPDTIFTGVGNPTINKSGQVAFRGSFCTVGVSGFCTNAPSGDGVWATDLNGELTAVVRAGDILDVDGDPNSEILRTVRFVFLNSFSGGEDGRGSSLNDLGQIALILHFTDGSQGVFVASLVPEPSALVLACVGVGAVLVARRRWGNLTAQV